MLTYAHVRVEILKRFKETEARLQLTRDDVIRGLLRAAQEGSPMAMIAAYREIGKMLGYYNPPVGSAPQDYTDSLVRSMPDKKLRALV